LSGHETRGSERYVLLWELPVQCDLLQNALCERRSWWMEATV